MGRKMGEDREGQEGEATLLESEVPRYNATNYEKLSYRYMQTNIYTHTHTHTRPRTYKQRTFCYSLDLVSSRDKYSDEHVLTTFQLSKRKKFLTELI